MSQRLTACVFLGLVLTACGVGDEGGNGNGNTADASSDDPDLALGVTCRATLDITGTVALGTPVRPTDPDTGMPITGCWPVGTWTFTASVDTTATEDHPCASRPVLLPQYQFRVDRMLQADGSGLLETYAYLGDMAMLGHLKVSEGGGGECEAGLELWSIDNKTFWNLKPDLTQTTLTGHGDYVEYKTPQMRQ